LAGDKVVSVFVEDESRIGLFPAPIRQITAKGVKPVQEVQHVFESYYLYGVVEPLRGESSFVEMPWLNTRCFEVFLRGFSKCYRDRVNIIISDNAAPHRAKRLPIPENVILLFLPPYSPELNPIERLWQDIKHRVYSSLYSKLEELKDAVASILNSYSKSTIASITGYPYLIEAINAL
jgi:putative transposase